MLTPGVATMSTMPIALAVKAGPDLRSLASNTVETGPAMPMQGVKIIQGWAA